MRIFSKFSIPIGSFLDFAASILTYALFDKLEAKASHGKKLSKGDLAPLLLTPLMAGTSPTKERMLKAEKLLGTADSLLEKTRKDT